MDAYVFAPMIGVLAVFALSLLLARLIPDDYDQLRPARVVARDRPG